MQAIIISALDMWPAVSTTPTTSGSTPPPQTSATSSTTTTSVATPYRPFEAAFDEFRPNPFPSPEPPAPPPAALSPPLVLGVAGSQWTLSPPAEDRASVETAETVS